MPHQVFISASAKDETIAKAACDALERRGMRCWMAPRDILPGALYAQVIEDAINATKVTLLILTAQSNNSDPVLREVERTVSKGIPLLVMKAEEITVSNALACFVDPRQWLEATDGNLASHLPALVAAADRLRLVGKPVESASAGASGLKTPAARGLDLGSRLANERPSTSSSAALRSISETLQASSKARMESVKQSLERLKQASAQVCGPAAGRVEPAPAALRAAIPGSPALAPAFVGEIAEPDELQVRQSAGFVFASPFIQGNQQYCKRVGQVAFLYVAQDRMVNAFATDSPKALVGHGVRPPAIVFLGGLAAASHVVALALAAHIEIPRARGLWSARDGLAEACLRVGRAVFENRGHLTHDARESVLTRSVFPLMDGQDEHVFSVARSLAASMESHVIAHEAGHIALGHTLGRPAGLEVSRNQEREADSFAASALCTSPFREYLFLGAAFVSILLAWMEAAGGNHALTTHPAARDRFMDLFQSNSGGADEAARRFGLTQERLVDLLPPVA